jgi:hypothetical protein
MGLLQGGGVKCTATLGQPVLQAMDCPMHHRGKDHYAQCQSCSLLLLQANWGLMVALMLESCIRCAAYGVLQPVQNPW